jgi:hypothetical protein
MPVQNARYSLKTWIFFAIFCLASSFICVQAQTEPPLTSKEIVALVYQLPKNPEKRNEIVEVIRKRGIGFPLTDGLRSVVATKSGNDALLRRTLEEAERRRLNPAASALPPEAEGNQLLEQTRASTLAAAEAMPDFIVKQVIRRSAAFGTTNNWRTQDNLSIAVSYRASVGEEYKVLTVNGMPPDKEAKEGREYGEYVGGGATSTGEYVSRLANLFKPESRTTFKLVDTDLLRGRRTLVYDFETKQPYSSLVLKADRESLSVGSQGRIWIDREKNRVIRFEQMATEIAPGFPITAASSLMDYDWVTINEQPFLLPTQADIRITSSYGGRTIQRRNEIRFRGYQKYGAELKVIDEIDEKDFPPDPPEPPKTNKP